ncbi:MAG: ABC transporter permease [Candidatus Krumholzibacteriia bacterium]
MRTIDFVAKESFRRTRQSITGAVFILLGVSIFVASQTINKALHDRSKEQLLRFGANIIVQPKGEPLDLYSGTVSSEVLLPSSYVNEIRAIKHKKMLVAVSPKLYDRFEVGERSLLVAGITPDESKAKPWWMIESRLVTSEFPENKQILLGHHAAARLDADVSEITLGEEVFTVSGVLDETGSPDDFLAFVPLAELQRISRKKGMVNLIEVSTSCIACKAMNVYDVTKEIGRILPADASTLAVRQIAEAQMGTLKKITRFAITTYVVVLGLCAFILINYMSASVDARRREIGMLLAMGMDPRTVQRVFVSKVLVFAAVGGILGYVAGSAISAILGPVIAGAKVLPVYTLLPTALGVAIGLGAISSIIPARRISALDPVEALREV